MGSLKMQSYYKAGELSLFLILRMLAPYFSVIVGWLCFKNGWLAILLYHAQIIFWALLKEESPRITGLIKFTHTWILPSLLLGVAAFLLLPVLISHSGFREWLNIYKLLGYSLVLMIPYFGLLHPILEEYHWRPITEITSWGHFFFAFYHALVLYSRFPLWLVVLCVLGLLLVSVLWSEMYKREGHMLSAILFHIFADLSGLFPNTGTITKIIGK